MSTPADASMAVMGLLEGLVVAPTTDQVLVLLREFAAAVTGRSVEDITAVHRYEPAEGWDDGPLAQALEERRPVVVDDEPDAGTTAIFPVQSFFDHPMAAISVTWSTPVQLDDQAMGYLTPAAAVVSRVLDRQVMIAEGLQEIQRSRDIAQLSVALARAETLEEVVARMIDRGALPLGAAGVVVGLVDREAGVLHRHFADLMPASVAATVATEPLDGDTPMVRVALTGIVELFAGRAEVAHRAPTLLAAWDATGWSAYSVVPLLDIEGEPFGCLGIGWADAVAFDQPLLAALTTVSELVAQAVQRTRLAAALALDVQRHRRLAEFSRQLALAVTPADVERTVVEMAMAFDTVTAVSFTWVDPDDPEPASVDSPAPAAASQDGASSTLEHPVRAADGRLLALVRFERSTAGGLEEGSLLVLATASEMLAATLQRIALSTVEHALIADLQSRVLTAPSSHPGLEVASVYRPSSTVVSMGGDWYHALSLPDGRFVVAVGDVVGHGAAAAIDMAQLAGVTGVALRAGTTLERLFGDLDGALADLEVLATMAVFEIAPGTGEVRYVSAGHPPALVVHPDGRLDHLLDGRRPMLGVPAPPVTVATAPLPLGASLVAYTDGLVERRGEHLARGIERVAETLVAVRHLPVADLLDAVVAAGTDGTVVQDDIAAVAVRAVPVDVEVR